MMAVDWDADPKPEMPEHAKPPEMVEIRTFEQALAWGDDWKRAFYRLESQYCSTVWRLEYLESLVAYLDPYLPRWLQDEKLRAANEPLYQTLADSRRDDAM